MKPYYCISQKHKEVIMAELEFEEVGGSVAPLDIEQPAESVKEAPQVEGKRAEELAAYKKHLQALQAELEEIEQKYPTDIHGASDALEKRVTGIEEGMREIKELLMSRQQQPVQPVQQFQPYPQQFPTVPMYQSASPIMPPVVTMPYGR
jgi:Skp family chaperone for outer membrane proteins